MLINGDAFVEIRGIQSKTVDLILIDPPYFISKASNFGKRSKNNTNDKFDKLSIDFGQWDVNVDFNMDSLFSEFYRVLKVGGTLISFYDIWKSSELKSAALNNKFKQPRVGAWVKKNPTPINSKNNYLSNGIEYFFTFVRGRKPTFHSKYDNGLYHYSLCHGRERYDHPTQKPLGLIEDLIKKHSNVGDLVLDTFAGTGTTAHACLNLGRNFIAIEKDSYYFDIMKKRIESKE
jgi:site-specific DNA-methyltransferase (adenine-specific)